MPSTVYVEGSVRKQVTCEACGHDYDYEMTRRGSGSYHGFAWTDRDGQEEALPEAEADLRDKLATDCDVVPCPKCGAITREMRGAEESSICGAVGAMLVATLVVGGVILALVEYWNARWPGGLRGIVIGVGVIACLFVLFSFLCLSVALAQRRERKEKGVTPPGQSPGTGGDPAPGAEQEVRETSRDLAEVYPDPRLRYRLRYDFVQRFLPACIHKDPRAFFSCLLGLDKEGCIRDPNQLIQTLWNRFEEVSGVVGPTPDLSATQGSRTRHVADLGMSLERVANKAVALISMPGPRGPLQASRIAVVLLASSHDPEDWREDVRARVFTLEAPMDMEWRARGLGVVCERTADGGHRNHGVGVPVYPAEPFMEVIERILAASERSGEKARA